MTDWKVCCSNEKAYRVYFSGNEPPAFVCEKCAANDELMFGAEKIIPLQKKMERKNGAQ